MSTYSAPLVGALLLDNELIPEVMTIVKPDHIDDIDLRSIYQAIVDLTQKDEPCDVVTVSEQCGMSLTEVAEIARESYSTERKVVNGWAVAVVKDARAYRLRAEISHLQLNAATIPYEQLVQKVATLALSAEQAQDDESRKTLSQLVDQSVKGFDDRYNGLATSMGISTGISDLDEIMRGNRPSDYVLIAGRPGSGKSVLALQGAWQSAIAEGEPTLFFSLEMPAEELIDRFMVMNSSLTSDEYAAPTTDLDPHKIETLAVPITKMKACDHLEIRDDIYDIDSMVAIAKEFKRKHGKIGALYVDYLQLIQGREQLGRTNEIGAYSRILRLLGMSLGCAVIPVAQLSRKCEERTDKRPLLSDLRESGSLEQDGTKIIMVYRDEMYNDSPDAKGIAELIVRKHRGGATGTAVVNAQMNRYRFNNLAKREY